MKIRRRVLLYGKSLILGTIAASLKQYPTIEIIPLTTPLPTMQELGALAPDAIIFDIEAAHPEFTITLLGMRPQLILIGIDPSSDQMQLWSGQHSRALTMQDLVQVIDPVPSPNRVFARGLAFVEHLCRFVSSHSINHYSKSR